jgi:hypothetical protein
MRRHPPHHLSPARANHPAGQDPEARLIRSKSPQQRSDQTRKPVNSEQDSCSWTAPGRDCGCPGLRYVFCNIGAVMIQQFRTRSAIVVISIIAAFAAPSKPGYAQIIGDPQCKDQRYTASRVEGIRKSVLSIRDAVEMVPPDEAEYLRTESQKALAQKRRSPAHQGPLRRKADISGDPQLSDCVEKLWLRTRQGANRWKLCN